MASSIKLFEFVEECHQTVGISSTQTNQRQRSVISIKTISLVSSAQIIFTTAAFLVFVASTWFDYGFAFYMLITEINSFVIYLIFVWQSKSTSTFIENCGDFIAKRVHSAHAYTELIGRIELMTKFLCFAISSTIASLVLAVLPYTGVRYYIFHMGEESFHFFCPSWFPFNWKTPSGYLVAWFAQFAGALSVGSMYILFPNLVFGSCWLFIFIAEDIARDVAAFNGCVETALKQNHAELMKRFCDVAKIYLDAKQCVMEFNQIIRYSLFAFFTWNMLGASGILVTLQFQLWADDSNSFEIISSCFVLLWMSVFIFLLCEPGAIMTNRFEAFSCELDQCAWYLLPIRMQRMYGILLSDTQHPLKMSSYANITCERETSKKIINKAFSYFMTMRRFRA